MRHVADHIDVRLYIDAIVSTPIPRFDIQC